MKKQIKELMYATLIGTAIYAAGRVVLENFDWENTRKEVVHTIDSNRDGIADSAEWAVVYRELGVDPGRGYGLDLDISQLEKYLKNHRQGGAK